jgi:predicted nucleic acid-binding protein
LIEVAIAGNAEAIVTNNTKDLEGGELPYEGLRMLKPEHLLREE